MQPDSIRPVAAARMESFTFSDDMAYFQFKSLWACGADPAPQTPMIQLILIIV
jgi:hypothetical protein